MSMNPPVRGQEFIFYIGLASQADPKLFQVNPTLAAGDVKVSKDGGAEANLTTLPAVTPAASTSVKVTVSAAEMAANNVTITFRDAAGAEWCDKKVDIHPNASIAAGTADTGGSSTSVPSSAFSFTPGSTSQLAGRILVFDNHTTTAALRGAGSPIASHTNSGTPTFTLTEMLPATPAAGDTYKIF